MGQIIQFPTDPKHPIPRKVTDLKDEAIDRSKCESSAKILFFTGVQYIRKRSLPSMRISRYWASH